MATSEGLVWRLRLQEKSVSFMDHHSYKHLGVTAYSDQPTVRLQGAHRLCGPLRQQLGSVVEHTFRRHAEHDLGEAERLSVSQRAAEQHNFLSQLGRAAEGLVHFDRDARPAWILAEQGERPNYIHRS